MIPEFELELTVDVPRTAAFWTPQPQDIGSEGFGFFRETWAIDRLTRTAAIAAIEQEQELVRLVDELSEDAFEYDALALAIEVSDASALPDRMTRGDIVTRLAPHMDDEEGTPFGGLELGVAGLVCALASLGRCFPAASCRAHSGGSWAPHPVVYVAADEFRVHALAPLVAASDCGFGLDSMRPELLVIEASTVTSMMRLAVEIVNNAKSFRKPRLMLPTRRRRVAVPDHEQLSLGLG